MISNRHIFKTPEELANEFAAQLMSWISEHPGMAFHMAISGGKTPDLLFDILAKKFPHSYLWQKVHFWWVDERMVGPNHAESNFGTANRLLFSQIVIPKENIHRIKGENDPEVEANSYSNQIQENLSSQNSLPRFDLLLLGMGDDGHTASIFPDQLHLMDSPNICEVAVNPQSGQQRITLTGKVINNASMVCFIVTGAGKADRMAKIGKNHSMANLLPAAHIHPESGNLHWYLDQAAAKQLS